MLLCSLLVQYKIIINSKNIYNLFLIKHTQVAIDHVHTFSHMFVCVLKNKNVISIQHTDQEEELSCAHTID